MLVYRSESVGRSSCANRALPKPFATTLITFRQYGCSEVSENSKLHKYLHSFRVVNACVLHSWQNALLAVLFRGVSKFVHFFSFRWL